MVLLGTLVNTVCTFLGGMFGLVFKRHISEALGDFLIMGQGLVCMLVAIQGMTGATANVAIVTICMGVGLLIGNALDIDARLIHIGDKAEIALCKLMHKTPEGTRMSELTASDEQAPQKPSFAQAFIYCSIYSCTGAMAIIGAMRSGIQLDHTMLYVKSVIDLVVCTVMAASMGPGIAFTAVSVLIYEGSLSLLANYLSPYLNEAVVSNIVVTGSLLLFAVALNLMKLANVKVANMLPAAFLPIILVPLSNYLSVLM